MSFARGFALRYAYMSTIPMNHEHSLHAYLTLIS